MDPAAEMALQGAAVPQASYHIEVSSVDGAMPPTESLPPEPVLFPPGGGGGSRSVVLVRSGSDSSPSGETRSVKYVLTGLQTNYNGARVGVTPVKSPAVPTAGQTTSAARARQILKKRLDLSLAEKKYTKMLHPELASAEGDGSGEPQSGHTPVMICEPEADADQKQGRTFFFVAKPPDEAAEDGQQTEAAAEAPPLPDDPAPSEAVGTTDLGVLKRLARYRLSEKFEILPAASLEDAEDIMHRLRVQNLMLKTELVRQATEYERHGDEHGLRSRRGRKKATTIVAVDRLRELEKIEAGMHTLFTPSQVRALSRDYKKNSVQWREEDFRRALGLLEHSSQHTFNYVRKVMNIPLPSVGTLKLRCPQQPELHVRLEAALQERGGGEGRCKQCSRRLSSAAAAAAAQGADGDGGDEGGYQQIQTLPAEEQQIDWATETPSRGILKRKRSRGGGTSARKTIRQDEEVVFYEAPVAPPPRGKARRSSSSGGGGGNSTGEGVHRSRPGLVGHYEAQQQSASQVIDDDEEDDEEEEPEDEEDFEEEFGEEVEGEVEIDPQQQEVPTQFANFRTTYEGGWNEWDPRQLQ